MGFVFVRIVDNGLSLLSRSGRVRVDCEGRGINKQMWSHILQIYGHRARFSVASFNNKNEFMVKRAQTGQLKVTLYRVCKTHFFVFLQSIIICCLVIENNKNYNKRMSRFVRQVLNGSTCTYLYVFGLL